MALGMRWVSRITSVALSFVIPVVAGVWIDRWLGSTPAGAVVGVILGFVVGTLQVVRIGQTGTPD